MDQKGVDLDRGREFHMPFLGDLAQTSPYILCVFCNSYAQLV